MKKKDTQCKRLLNFLLNAGKLTPLDSWKYLGIYRLASRIHELRTGKFDGICYPIKGETKEVKNSFGEKARVNEYYLEQEEIIKYKQLRFTQSREPQTVEVHT